MNLKKLKMTLGAFALSNLEEAGFVNAEDDGLIMRVTSEEHNKKFNEVMWASSVNNEDGNFALLMHGILYDKATAKEMGRPAEVAQVFINKEKAAMMLDTIRHAYPELMEEIKDVPVGGFGAGEDDEEEGIDLFSTEENEDEDDEEDDCETCGENCSICGEPLEEGSEAGPSEEDAPDVLNADQIIDAHLLVKKELQRKTQSTAEVKYIKIAEPYQYLYLMVPRENELAVTFDELDIVHQVKEAVNPPLLLKEEAAKMLLEAVKGAFPNLT